MRTRNTNAKQAVKRAAVPRHAAWRHEPVALAAYYHAEDFEDDDLEQDSQSAARQPERDAIDIRQESEVREWSRSLGCTDAQLLEAVQAVGGSPLKVREYLRRG